jgi:exonuclease III
VKGLGKNQDKLKNKDFLHHIKDYDIISLCETWTCKDANLLLKGFEKAHAPSVRKSRKAGRSSGGLVVYIRKRIANFVTCVKKEKNKMWFQLSAPHFGWSDDIFVGAVYCPPEESPYYDNYLDKLELDIAQYSCKGKVIIIGDLNARVGGLDDYVNNDDNNSHIPLPVNYISDNPPQPRQHCDTVVNKHGKQLIDIAISSQLRFLNGRYLGDSLGRFTFYCSNGASTIDYGLCHASMMNQIKHFTVFPLTEFSDHCQISITLKCHCEPVILTQPPNNMTFEQLPQKPRWNSQNKDLYLNNLWNTDTIDKLVKFMTVNYSLEPHSINKATADFTNIIKDASQPLLPSNASHRRRKCNQSKKPGYDNECYRMKILLRSLSKKLHNDPTNISLRGEVIQTKRGYKKLVKKKTQNYKDSLVSQLETLQSSNPKAYWQIVNKLKEHDGGDSKDADGPCPHELTVHYEKLNKQRSAIPDKIQTDIATQIANLEQSTPAVKTLDTPFTIKEIKTSIDRLKPGKSCGLDRILNEFLIHGKDILCGPIAKLFNLVLTARKFPSTWSQGLITSLHKSGDPTDPNNYRGLTLLSCLGKLFTNTLNNRLYSHLSSNKLLNKWQAGFMPNYRTTDQAYILQSIINKYVKCSKQKLYTCFVDFRKAFDLVWHEALFLKLLKLGIGGDFYHTVKNMYQESVVRVKTKLGISMPVESQNGVRQGDGISPLLFNIFINDLPDELLQVQGSPPTLLSDKIPALLYADDLIMFSETASGLQKYIDQLSSYCKKWQLQVNLSKTKTMIISKSKIRKPPHFMYENEQIENVDSYKYLGTTINNNGNFNQAKLDLKNKGTKALFGLWRAISPGKLPPVKVAGKLFESMIKPILLYNSEVWGAELKLSLQKAILKGNVYNKNYLKDIDECPPEQAHLKFCKMLLGVNRFTSNLASRAELGRFPLVIEIYVGIVKYWLRLNQLPEDRLVVDALKLNEQLHEQGHFTWSSMVKHILLTANLTDVWAHRSVTNYTNLVELLRSRLQQNYWSLAQREMHNDTRTCTSHRNKLRTYRRVKTNHHTEKYLETIKDPHIRASISKLRLSSHKLMIEKGRQLRLPLQERTCQKCTLNEVEDEFHAIMHCEAHTNDRETLFNYLNGDSPLWETLSEDDKFLHILNLTSQLLPIGKFFQKIIDI